MSEITVNDESNEDADHSNVPLTTSIGMKEDEESDAVLLEVDPEREENGCCGYFGSEEGFHFSREELSRMCHENLTAKQARANLYSAVRFVMYPNGMPLLSEIRKNLKSGITVSLVNVPLSISLAIAGGATPISGIVTAIWAGLIASLAGGSQYNIVGPTGALSGILAASSASFGEASLSLLAILGGILAVVVCLLRLDKYVMFIPSSVIHGFTIGVAFIIAFNQLDFVLGGTWGHTQENFLYKIGESLGHLPEANPFAILFFVVNLTALLLLLRKWPMIPWAIIISAIGILFGYLATNNILPLVTLQTLQERYGQLTFQLVTLPSYTTDAFSISVFASSFSVAFISILETLISARIADGMTKSEHNQRREVLGLGISNVICGVFGGIPATAALARTALNIKSGATSRISAFINCLSVLLISAVALPLFKFIPMPTIAALLVMTAYRMLALDHMIHMFKYDRIAFWIAILTAVCCIALDTMTGILVGGVVSLLLFTDKMSVGHGEVEVSDGTTKSLVHFSLDQGCNNALTSYLSSSKLKESTFSPSSAGVPSSGGHGYSSLPLAESSETSSNIPLLELNNNLETNLDSKDSFAARALAATLPPTAHGIPLSEEFGTTLVYRFTGQLTYVNASAHIARLKKLTNGERSKIKTVILALRYLCYIDLDGIDALKEIVQLLEDRHIKVFLASVINKYIRSALERHPFYQRFKQTGCIFPSYLHVLESLNRAPFPHSMSSPALEQLEQET